MVTQGSDKKKMIHALNMLARANNKNQNRHQLSSRDYEHIRSMLSESMKGENNPMYGKPAPNRNITHTDETRKKLSDANFEYLKTHPPVRLGMKASEETKEKQRGPKTEQAKYNMSVSAKQKPRLACLYCGLFVTTSNHTRWHGDKCKRAP